jgi:3-deoxy-D-manno-octulosonic-acid transferase
LGSAILFGPHVQGHRDTYSRLAAVGAGRSIGDAEGLGAAVIRLVAPDHAAAMALAGWQVVTEGAALSDRLVEMVQDRLDLKGAHHARP